MKHIQVSDQQIKIEEFDDSWECMKDRAVKLERLDKFYRQCKSDCHELTAVERNMCDAVEKECRRSAPVLPSCVKNLAPLQCLEEAVVVPPMIPSSLANQINRSELSDDDSDDDSIPSDDSMLVGYDIDEELDWSDDESVPESPVTSFLATTFCLLEAFDKAMAKEVHSTDDFQSGGTALHLQVGTHAKYAGSTTEALIARAQKVDKFCLGIANAIAKPNPVLARRKRWITSCKFSLTNGLWHFHERKTIVTGFRK